jgi:short-subunit dehydrogenase
MVEAEKRYAVITGASKGIGKSIAIALAKRGYHLLLIARSGDELNRLSQEIGIQFNVDVNTLAIDLAQPEAAKNVSEWINQQKYRIAVLVNNAGYGLWGAFAALNLEEQMQMCQLNMDTVVRLSYLLLPLLSKEKQAYILNVSSTAAYQAVPTLAVYSATKAFVLSFTRALRYELKNTPVSVTCLSPGPFDTGFAHRA